MFTGEYSHSVDAKGRIVLPAKFREELGESFYITKGNVTGKENRMVRVYPVDSWTEYAQKLAAIPESDRIASKYARSILSGAVLCEPDKNGRIPIPENLRKFASIEKEVVSIGQFNKIEIWDKTKWDTYNDDDFDEAELNESLAKYGL